jgi:murein DD-endopeptidase MepM/ murein hydrolase activator NlpD
VLSVLAMMWIIGITATHALPAFALEFSEDTSSPPALDAANVDDLQHFTVPSSAASPKASRDLLEGFGKAAPEWTLPTAGDLRDRFGPRLARPVAGVSSFHRGQDIGGSCGQSIRAAAGGTVVQAGYYGTYGNWVLIDHGNGVQTGYAHASALLVRTGQRVDSGQLIATVGTTGASSGCHLHLETHINGGAVDPVAFLAQRGVTLG